MWMRLKAEYTVVQFPVSIPEFFDQILPGLGHEGVQELCLAIRNRRVALEVLNQLQQE